ncbi:MAG: hypothetical protein PHH20_03390 [Candidatus Omnitrophica bacterium]|nr:hypothetical protein [Candidatus Omnitrophota bacterium]
MKKVACLAALLLLIAGCKEYEQAQKTEQQPQIPVKAGWDDLSQWKTDMDGKSAIELASVPAGSGEGIRAVYELRGDYGWVLIRRKMAEKIPEDVPLTFLIKSDASSDMEIKLVDADGSVFFRKFPLRGKYADWTQVVVYRNNLEYGWGGDEKFDKIADLEIAFSGKGKGTVDLDEIGLGKPALPATFSVVGPVLDPDRELKGIGFKQRRAAELIPEDPLVLEWLKLCQDNFSTEKQLLPTAEDNQAHTFNNALVAMAFIVKGEKERAERILDFFAESTVVKNRCPSYQNFFYKGEPRGFFQYVNLRQEGNLPAYHNPGKADRWMGDMSWLLIAYKYYEKEYGPERYKDITGMLKDLLISWYKDDPGGKGGFVQHGWRSGDKKLHEDGGHPEGNIDCYAALKLCKEDAYADKIRVWLDSVLKGNTLPLDNYTWRVLAYGKGSADLLNIPEYDLRYRKTLNVNGKEVMGFFDHADISVNNIWLDGTGHIACAYITEGDKERGYFYANQMDAFLVDRTIKGAKGRTIPYTANREGGYNWSRADMGTVSVASWYIFAKNKFNPLTLEKAP